MTQTSFPFDSGPGSTVLEAQWSKMAREWRPTGVLPGVLSECAVTAPGSGLTVQVAPGRAWVEGHLWESDATESLVLTAAHPSLPRIDRVILRLDWSNNTISLGVLTGTPASTPVAPALTQTTALWEISLAQVSVPAGATTITNANITDERPWASGPGAVRMPAVASAPSLALATVGYNSPRLLVLPVTGSTDISDIPVLPAGTWLLVECAAAVRIVSSSTLLLAQSDYRAPAGGQLLLVSTGTAWREVARSAPLAASTTANQVFAGPASGAAAPSFRALVTADLPAVHGWRLRRATALAIANATLTSVAWDAEDTDTDNYHAANSTDVVIPSGLGGWYAVTAYVRWQLNATGLRSWRLRTAVVELASATQNTTTVLETDQTISWVGRLAAGETLLIDCFQTSGGALNIENVALFAGAYLGA